MRAIFISWLLALVSGLISVHLGFASVGVRYAAMTAIQLVVVVVLTVAVAAGVCILVLTLIDRFAAPLINSSALLHVAWHLLRSQRSVPTLRTRIGQGLTSLQNAPSLRRALWTALGIVLITLTPHFVQPWAPWVIPTRDVMGMAAAVALGVGVLRFLLAKALSIRAAKTHKPSVARFRQRRGLTLPTFIAVVGIAVGVWALIVVLSVMRGFGEDLREKILQVDAHVHVESAVLDTPLPDAEKLMRAMEENSDIAEVHPMVVGRVILTTPFNVSASVDIKGVDPATYGNNLTSQKIVESNTFNNLLHPENLLTDMRVREHLRDGLRAKTDKGKTTRSWTDESTKSQGYTPPSRLFPGIILGTELANSLQVGIGDKVQVISPDGDETPFGTIRPRTRSFRVAGIFHSGMYQYDLRLAYMAYWEAARLLQVTGGPNHIEVVAHDAEQSRKISNQLQGMVQADTTEIRDWTVMNQALLSALAVERIAMFLVLGFIVLVASFNIVGSLVLIIMEKGREIAILRAMGGSSRWVGRTFLAVGVFIGVIGIGTGLGLGLLSCAVVALVGLPLPREYYVETVPVDVDPLLVITVVLVTAAVTLAATLYPTRTAARLVPSEGLRYE